jgi:Polyketide cyclase / dehydrase and lipid transport
MITAQQQFDVAAAPDATFRFVAAEFFENQPKWALTQLTRDGTGPVGMGTTGQEVRRVPMGKSASKVNVTAFDAPARFSYTTDSNVAHATVSYRFEPAGGGTRVTHRVELEPQGIGRLLSFVMSRSLDGAASADMARLKDLLGRLPPPSAGAAGTT